MKPYPAIISAVVCSIVLAICSCDLFSTAPQNATPTLLNVRFENSTGSDFAICSIELMAMGKAGSDSGTPSGSWSDNLLTGETTIAPGAHQFFSLAIPNLHWSTYRLGVIDGQGNPVMLHEQSGVSENQMKCSITHWGSDDRTVSVSVIRDPESGFITVNGYSDFAGIDAP